MKTKIALFILCIFTLSAYFIACENNVSSVEPAPTYDGYVLQNIFDSITAVHPLLKDFRENPTLNSRVVVKDIPGQNDEGRTIISCDGAEIFNNSWNIPSYEHDRMRTKVRHGYCSDNTYFLWVYNISEFGAGVGSEYRIFIIQNNGPIADVSSKFKTFKYGIAEMETGKWIVKSTNGWVRAPQPGVYTILYADGKTEEYSIPWNDFH